MPTMGGISQVGDTDHVAYTGGKPKHDWSGLDGIKPTNIKPTQYRPESIGASSKGLKYRTEGLEIKFTRKSDQLIFQMEIWKRMKDYGMDTIAYLPDPYDPTEVASVVDEHAKYTIEGATKLEQDRYPKLDKYDHANMRDATTLLLNSVDDDIKKSLYEMCTDDDSFIVYWMNLMSLVRSVSIDQYDIIKNKLKERNVKQYAGENIENMASDYLADWKELDGAGMYDHKLTHHMLKQLLRAGGNDPDVEEFRGELRELKNAIRVTRTKTRPC